MASADEMKELANALEVSKAELEEVMLPGSNINKRKEWANTAGNGGFTLLQFVLWRRLWEYVPFLLKLGADVNVAFCGESAQFKCHSVVCFISEKCERGTLPNIKPCIAF